MGAGAAPLNVETAPSKVLGEGDYRVGQLDIALAQPGVDVGRSPPGADPAPPRASFSSADSDP